MDSLRLVRNGSPWIDQLVIGNLSTINIRADERQLDDTISGCTDPRGFQIKSENTFAFKQFHDLLDPSAIDELSPEASCSGKIIA
jgi:hypothetical protein